MKEKCALGFVHKAFVYCLLVLVSALIFGLVVSIVDLWGIARLTGRYPRQPRWSNLLWNMKAWSMIGGVQAGIGLVVALVIVWLRRSFTVRRALLVAGLMPICNLFVALALVFLFGPLLPFGFGGCILGAAVVAFLLSSILLTVPERRDVVANSVPISKERPSVGGSHQDTQERSK